MAEHLSLLPDEDGILYFIDQRAPRVLFYWAPGWSAIEAEGVIDDVLEISLGGYPSTEGAVLTRLNEWIVEAQEHGVLPR